MLMAVVILSPVSTHSLMPPSFRSAIVSGTPSFLFKSEKKEKIIRASKSEEIQCDILNCQVRDKWSGI